MLRFTFLLLISLPLSGIKGMAEPPQENLFSQQRSLSLLPKKDLTKKRLGLNSFVNDQRFGSVTSQLREVRTVLGIKYVRVLFNWNDQIQSNPASQPFFGFYDEIARSIPRGVQALVVVNGLPSWMDDSGNWINGNPRTTFVKLWVEPVVKRYGSNKKIKAFQIWNEPNMTSDEENRLLELDDSPANYVEMLAEARQTVKANSKRKKVIAAATTAINQNYPETLDYNKGLLDAGVEEACDIFAVHFYGEHLENFYRPDNILDLLEKVKKPIWATESGEKGVNEQKEYAQRMWPFLLANVKGLKRIYIYQHTEATDANQTYGLRNLTQGSFLSDLFIYLRDLRR